VLLHEERERLPLISAEVAELKFLLLCITVI